MIANNVIRHFERKYPMDLLLANGDYRREVTHGWTPRPGCWLLQQFVEKLRPQQILEIGVYFGYGALYIADKVRELGLDTRMVLVDIDPVMIRTTEWNLGMADRRRGIHAITGDSKEIMPRLIELGERFEMIYVDGGHSPQDAAADVESAKALLSDRGAIVVDDCFTQDPGCAVVNVVRDAAKNGWIMEVYQARYGVLKQVRL